MRNEINSDDGRELYKRRSQIIEPVFAHTKILRRTDRFQRRGLNRLPRRMAPDRRHPNLLKLWRMTTPPLPA